MQDPKEPLYIPGDLVTRNIITSIILIYEIDEVLASGDTFLYHLKPYKAGGTHRHIPEMERNLGRILAQGRRVRTHGEARAVRLSFTPHLVPMTRGILVTAEAEVEGAWSQESLEALYRDFYAGEPFVRVLKGLPETKATLGSNRVDVRPLYEERTGRVLVFAALDNLVKGMAGQAVQNLNLMLGLPEETALPKEGLWP